MYEWDDKKNQVNIIKHNMSFDLAKLAFDDPYLIEIYDDLNSTDEHRYNVIGAIENRIIAFVVATDRNGKTRIISARKASPKEKRFYESELKKRTRGS